MGRFSGSDHLVSYAGLVPITKSNVGVQRHGRITREGSSWLQWARIEAVIVHLRYDTPITRFYHRVAERWGRKAALVATARKLVTVCYSVLVNRKPYYDTLNAQV